MTLHIFSLYILANDLAIILLYELAYSSSLIHFFFINENRKVGFVFHKLKILMDTTGIKKKGKEEKKK